MLFGDIPITKQSDFINPSNVFAEDVQYQEYKVDDDIFIYSRYENKIVINGYFGNKSFVTIPEEIDGCPVIDVCFEKNQYTENDNSDNIISLTLPDTVRSVMGDYDNNLMQIRGTLTGYAMEIAQNLHVSFEDVDACAYNYLKYEEAADGNITIKSIVFSPTITSYTIPDEIDGKSVTKIDLSSYYVNNNPDDYNTDYPYIPEYFDLTITNPDVLFSSESYYYLEHCTIYAYPGSTAQVFAYDNNLNYIPIEKEVKNQETTEYTFRYETFTDENEESNICIFGINEDNIEEVVIPESIDGIPVTELIIDNRYGKKITIPNSVRRINTYDLNSDVFFYVNSGSYACDYAKQNGIPYKYIGLPDEAYFKYDFYRTGVSEGEVTVIGYGGTDSSITIPSKMYGIDVTNVDMCQEDCYIEEITVHEKVSEFYVNSSSLKLIRGYKNSAAERYAKEIHNIKFEAIVDLSGLRYALYDDHAEIISCEPNYLNGLCEIPSKVHGRTVTKILSGAFDIRDYNGDYYIDIPASVNYIADDVFGQDCYRSNVIIRADAGSYAIDFAKANYFRYEETEIQQEDLLRYCRIEGDSEENKYLTISEINEFFIDEEGIVKLPEQIDGITVKRINASLNYQYFPSIPVAIYIPSSVTEINISCRDNNTSGGSNLNISDCITEIRGEMGSFAQEYARRNNVTFTPNEDFKYNTSYFYEDSGYAYENNGSTLSITCDQNVVYATIPEQVGNVKVGRVYFQSPYLKSITFLNPNIELNEGDFQECSNLKEIRGYMGSTAERYAIDHGIKFVRIFRNANDESDYQPELSFDGETLVKCDISAVDINICDWVTDMDINAFKGCTALKSVHIPGSITDIPETLFADCINLTEIHGSEGSAAEAYAANHNISFIAKQASPRYIVFERGYSNINDSDNSIYYDLKITGYDTEASKIEIPEKINNDIVKKIGQNAFYNLQGTETFEIPEFIEYVESGAFYKSGVKNVILPKNIKYIENVYYDAYGSSEKDKSITVLNPNAEIGYDVDCNLIGYYGSTAHEYAKQNNLRFTAIPDETDIAPDYLEYEICGQGDSDSYSVLNDPYVKITRINNAEEAEIPETINGIPVKEIDCDAFSYSTSIKKLKVLARGISISNYNRYGLSCLEKAVVYGYYEDNATDSITSILDVSKDLGIPFIDIDNTIELPEGIRFQANYDCVYMYSDSSIEGEWTTWTIPESMYGMPITEVNISSDSLTEIVLPESVSYISLTGLPNLEKLVINNSECEFDGGESLTDVYAPIDNKYALNHAANYGIKFHDINSDIVYSAPTGFSYKIYNDNVIITQYIKGEELVDLVIPDTIYGIQVYEISDYAFNGCASLKTVVIPESVYKIGKEVFYNCPSLEKITFYGNQSISADLCSDEVIIQSEPFSKAFFYAQNYGNPFMNMDGVIYEAPENIKYTFLEDHIAITSMIDDAEECIIPESIYGVPVTEICENAFNGKDVTLLKKVVVPDSVTVIAKNTFPSGTVIWGYVGSAAETYAKDNGFEFVDIDIAEQNWDYIDWHWENFKEDGTVTAELKSYDDETYSRILNATVKTDEITPTCTEDGRITYIAEVVIDGSTYKDKLMELLDPIGHSYYVSEWLWADDHSECSAIFGCSNCDTITEPQIASINLETSVEPTCTEDGSDTYTAEITFGGKVHSNSVTTKSDAIGHNYEITEWNWSDDRQECEVILECSNCSASQTKTAVVTHEELAPTCTADGYDNYIAELEFEGEVFSDRNDLVLTADGHKSVISKWIWAEDRTSCTAELKCDVCSEITDSIEAEIEHQTLAPTCTKTGYDNYIARITIDNIVYSDSNEKIIAENGHDFFADLWTWSDDYTECSVVVKCHNCNTIINNIKANVSSEIINEPTYDETGTVLYTATCSYANEIFTTTKEAEIPVKERTDISSARVSISETSFDYDGTEKNVNVISVKLNGVLLTEGVDYMVTGNTATESGDYALTVTGIGAYKGKVSKYWKIVRYFKVSYTLNGDKKSYIYTENAFCNARASEVEGKIFSHWRLTGSDTILSYSDSYTFRVVSDTDIEAVYVEDGESVTKEPVVAITSVRAFDNKIYYEITRDIPEDYKVISNGILYGTSTSMFVESDENSRDINLRFTDDIGSTTAKDKVYTATSSINNNKGYYSYYLNVGKNTDRPIYLRGYVIIQDSQNNIHTYYTKIVGKTYNEILSK